MTPTQKAAMEMALHALSPWHPYAHTKVTEALRAALAEQPAEQEPVAWMCSNTELMHKGYQMFSATKGGDWNIPVYTAPQPTKQPLTDEEICDALEIDGADDWTFTVARAIEAAHGITGGAK